MTGEQQFALWLAAISLIGGGLIGLVTAHFTRRAGFSDARRLQTRDHAIRELALARALSFELAVNATSSNSRLEGGGLALLSRSAYEDARQLELPTEVEALLGLAYEEAELYNATTLMYRSVVLTDLDTLQNVKVALRPADVRTAFQDALAALTRHLVIERLQERVDKA